MAAAESSPTLAHRFRAAPIRRIDPLGKKNRREPSRRMTARILIVDDVPANIRLLEARLQTEYYRTATARDGFEAIATAKDWQPDLILLDVMMPGMDGFEGANFVCSTPLRHEEHQAELSAAEVCRCPPSAFIRQSGVIW